MSNHALRKSIEEHAQQCFSQVSAKEIVHVALLSPLLEPIRICAAYAFRRPRVVARLLRRVGRVSVLSRLGRFGCAALLGGLFHALLARGMGPFALLWAVAAGAAFQAGMLLCLGGAAICLFGLVARFVSREQIRQFFSPPLMEAAAYLTCVVAYTHLLGTAAARKRPARALLRPPRARAGRRGRHGLWMAAACPTQSTAWSSSQACACPRHALSLPYATRAGFALFRAETCEAAEGAPETGAPPPPCEAAATATLVSLWCWAVQLGLSLLKIDDDAQRLRCLDVPNVALLWLWLLRGFSEARVWVRYSAGGVAAAVAPPFVVLRGEAAAFGCMCAALQCIYLVTQLVDDAGRPV